MVKYFFRLYLIFFALAIFTQSFLWGKEVTKTMFSNEKEQTAYEEKLISHVQNSISQAEKGLSKLNRHILNLEGMSGTKGRHLLNNLCSLPNTGYLEIGVWAGSTFASALYHNGQNLSFAVAIDNWSEFGGPKEQFHRVCKRYLRGCPYKFYEADSFQLDLDSVFNKAVNIYFYDGGHQVIEQEQAFTYYDSILDNVFIAVIDDWNWSSVQEGTRNAFEKLGYEILFEQELPSPANQDKPGWWNGIYIAVIRKPHF